MKTHRKATRMGVPSTPLQSVTVKPGFSPVGSRKPKRKFVKCERCGNPCREQVCFKCRKA